MSHNVSHNVRHGVTPRGRDAFRTPSVTLLQTRPDQTRVFIGFSCGVSTKSKEPSPRRPALGIGAM